MSDTENPAPTPSQQPEPAPPVRSGVADAQPPAWPGYAPHADVPQADAPTASGGHTIPPAAPEQPAPGQPAPPQSFPPPQGAPHQGFPPPATAPYPGGYPQPEPPATAPYPGGYAQPAPAAFADPAAPTQVLPPMVAGPTAPKKSRKGLWFALGGGALALILVATGVIIAVNVLTPRVTADMKVEELFEALADSDAEDALALTAGVDDTTFLTDDVLEASNALAPIAFVNAEEPKNVADAEGQFTVDTVYSVGDEEIATTLLVSRSTDAEGEEVWQVADMLFPLNVPFDAKLEPTLAGLAVTPDETAMVFPGTYAVALGNAYFEIVDNAPIAVTHNNAGTAVEDLHMDATADTRAAFTEMVTTTVNECMALKTLATPCGMDLTNISLEFDYTPTEGTVTRTPSEDVAATIAATEIAVSDDGVLTSGLLNIPVEMTLDGTLGAQAAQFIVEDGSLFGIPWVDFAADTPVVQWY